MFRKAMFAGYLFATNICLVSSLAWGSGMNSRSLFLNGIDISSARNQEMKNVTIRIDESGNLFIEAPQYNVREESEYLPVTKWIEGQGHPQHAQHPQHLPVPGRADSGGSAPTVAEDAANTMPPSQNLERPAQTGDMPKNP